MCKITNAYRLSCFLAQCIILVFRGVLAVGMQNSYMLQLRYEQHLVDEARSSPDFQSSLPFIEAYLWKSV